MMDQKKYLLPYIVISNAFDLTFQIYYRRWAAHKNAILYFYTLITQ